MNVTDEHITEAREMGRAAGLAAASWVADGNTSDDHARRVLSMLDDGDPQAYDLLPAEPNLSGEWADDLTPMSLYRDITGRDPDEGDALAFETNHGWLIDALANAFEDGVMETFEPECARILRTILTIGDDAR